MGEAIPFSFNVRNYSDLNNPIVVDFFDFPRVGSKFSLKRILWEFNKVSDSYLWGLERSGDIEGSGCVGKVLSNGDMKECGTYEYGNSKMIFHNHSVGDDRGVLLNTSLQLEEFLWELEECASRIKNVPNGRSYYLESDKVIRIAGGS